MSSRFVTQYFAANWQNIVIVQTSRYCFIKLRRKKH